MTAEACRATFESEPDNERAARLDSVFPRCACEVWSLTEAGGDGVDDGEVVVRILTSPNAYNLDTATIITERLTVLYSAGLSVIRQGASNDEIIKTIETLLIGGAEQKSLVGAIVMQAAKFRSYANDDDRWFGVYATDDCGKAHHVDVLGTTPIAESKGAVSREKKARRYKLALDMQPYVVFDSEPERLIEKLRGMGC